MEFDIRYFQQLNSTNSELQLMIKKGGCREGVVLVSEYQQKGRGQGANSWFSDEGNNILMSLLLCPAFLSVSEQFLLSKAVALGVKDFLAEYSIEAEIKWPNDILCSGKKIAGMLIEHSVMGSRLRTSVIGVGLNVNQLQFPDFERPATSMKELRGMNFELKEVLNALLASLGKTYSILENSGWEDISRRYCESMYRLNVPTIFRSEKGVFEGMIRGVNEFGQLRVEQVGGVQDGGGQDGGVQDGRVQEYGLHELKMLSL